MQTLIVSERAPLFAALAGVGNSGDPRWGQSVSDDLFNEADRLAMLALLQKGWSCRAIAAEQGVSVPIVKARLMALYRQTGRRTQTAQR